MSTLFPGALDDSTSIPSEGATIPLSTNHVTSHQNIQDAIEAIEAKVGVNSSAVTTTHDYKLGEVTSTDKAVGKTATQTLTNKTLTAPVITSPTINLTSDAEGDTYYRNSSGAFVRLPRGTDNYIYKMNGNVPNWEAEATISNATSTTTGISELATSAEITAGTATGGSGGPLVVTPDQLLAAGIRQTDIQTFTADGTWTKPTNAKSVLVQMWGAGGGGAGGASNAGGGGGGGGSYAEQTFNAADLSSTEAIVVGVGAAATTGTNSSIGTTKLVAYGGGAGTNVAAGSGAGGGGGISGAGDSGSGTSGGNGGSVLGGSGGAPGGTSTFGGGGGGNGANTGSAGGQTVYGGGGAGGGANNAGVPGNGGAGAASFYAGGGGGGGGGNSGGAGGVSQKGGNGGAGVTGTNNGNAGSIPAGGGGGGCGTASTGGAGARGQVVITTYF